MDPREAQVALREARRWAAEGLVTPEALAAIETRYAADAAREPEAGLASLALYGAGGALLGAAAIALVVFLEIGDMASYALLALAAAFAGAGFALARAGRDAFGDALVVASLVALVAMSAHVVDDGGVDGRLPMTILGALAPPALLALRGGRLVPLVASLAYFPLLGMAIASAFDVYDYHNEDVLAGVFFAGAVAFLALALALGRARAAAWRPEVTTVAAVGVCAGSLAVSMTSLAEVDVPGWHELVVGVVAAALIGLGFLLKEKGLVVGGALVISLDAIVFAFDVGGLVVGVLVLVATAGVMLWRAEAIRRYVKESA